MSKAVLVVRLLLGFVFFFFGLNGILHFLPQPAMSGDVGTWITIMVQHHYMTFVAVLQVIAGLLLMVGRYVPLGLVILAPILVNILLFHFLLELQGVAIPLVCTVMELFLIWAYRLSFRGLLDAAPEVG